MDRCADPGGGIRARGGGDHDEHRGGRDLLPPERAVSLYFGHWWQLSAAGRGGARRPDEPRGGLRLLRLLACHQLRPRGRQLSARRLPAPRAGAPERAEPDRAERELASAERQATAP